LPIIIRGIEEGKSMRGIARELGCDDKTIARDLRKLALPAEQLAAIQEGDSVEKYLNEALLRETGIDRSARDKLTRRRRQEEQSGKHSDDLARAVLGWFSTKELTNDNLEIVLNHVKREIEWLRDSQLASSSRTFGDVVEPVERNPNVDRRLTLPELDFLNRCASGLVIGLPRVEPLQVIRQSALDKAIKVVCARGHWMDKIGSQTERDNIAKRRNLRGGK
jgi:hypothetical protein